MTTRDPASETDETVTDRVGNLASEHVELLSVLGTDLSESSEAIVDDAATSFPDLNFIVEHVGYPRLDDFCHIATQETNVYGGLAVAAPFARNRPRKFGNMMGKMLFWVGEDNLLFGSDYAIWEPDWLIPAVMNAEMTQDQRDEFGVELTPEIKKKFMGENAAELYDIDIEAKKEQFRDDEISREFGLGDRYEEAAAD